MPAIRCEYTNCQGVTTSDYRCTDHGELCSECLVPSIHQRPDKKCVSCAARAEGAVCAGCGSPWICLTYFEDQKWRCRVCVSTLIMDNGWDETPEEIMARLKAAEEKFQQEKAEKAARHAAFLQQDTMARTRKTNKDQEEALFTLQDKKKRKKQ